MTAQLTPTPALPTSRRARAFAWLDRIERLPHAVKLGLKIAAAVVGLLLLVAVITAPLDLERQFAFAGLCLGLLLILRKVPGRMAVLAMIVLSLIATLRYVYWRLADTLGFDNWLDMFFGYGLVAAETYALIILAFGYMQTAWPLKRKPKILTQPPEEWPVVDVFVPTYNEELSIVKLTVLAAQAMDWPPRPWTGPATNCASMCSTTVAARSFASSPGRSGSTTSFATTTVTPRPATSTKR